MNDNSTPFSAKDYDDLIHKTMPYYESFHESAIDLVKAFYPNPVSWLDTGCGTGSFAHKAFAEFKDTIFYLADPSAGMIETAKIITENIIQKSTAELNYPENKFDVITSILSHHYLNINDRRSSTENCMRMLKQNGIYITFENIRPLTSDGFEIFMKRWYNFKLANGAMINENEHYSRFDHDYFPITIIEHIDLLKQAGFKTVEMFWMSYMQAGFFAIK